MQVNSENLLEMTSIMPVVEIADADCAVPLAEALKQGGIAILEVVLRTPDSLAAISRIRKEVPGVIVGAGTVTSLDKFHAAVDAGSEFIVTPGLTPTLAKASADSPLPVLPGISRASDIMLGQEYGYRAFKFFPAEASGGIPALKALAGPFGDVAFCPTGGIGLHNIADYLSLPSVACVGGSWLTSPDLQKRGDWQAITQRTEEAVTAARGATQEEGIGAI
jgi:2-dehydro-3-deoxyphosphogluconate aldolase/(4S)-4-hydroxy-2-oxoglutarate aldolase